MAKANSSRSRWLPTWAILTGVILFLAYLYIGGDYGLWQYYQQQKLKEQYTAELAKLRAQQDSLRILIRKLKTDSSFIARVAREKYNMGLSDEEIIRVITKESQ